MISLVLLCCAAASIVNAQNRLDITSIPVPRPTDVVGKCPSGASWTRFYSTDTPNPNDIESLNVFRRRYKICDPKKTIVTGVRARVASTFFWQPYWTTRNVLELDLNGLRCLYNSQPYETLSTNPYTPSQRRCPCRDYEISFCCPEHGIVGDDDKCTWGAWLDRDDPTGTGDWELRSYHRCYCPNGAVPDAIQGRIFAPGQPLHYAPWTACNQVITISASYGLVCKNDDQIPQNTTPIPECKDYQVRYCCPNQNVITSSTCREQPPFRFQT